MIATGIVRRIDDLGRVVIPKEIRRSLRIQEGDPLEIFTDKDGYVLLKKYSPLNELNGNIAKSYAESISETTGYTTCIVNNDSVIAVSGKEKRLLIDKRISDGLRKKISMRQSFSSTDKDPIVYILENESDTFYNYQHISPIISEGDIIGAVILLSNNKPIDASDEKICLMSAKFLAKLFEI